MGGGQRRRLALPTRGGQVQAGFSHRKERAEGKVKAQARWSTCALTGEALRAPVVACDLGLLYNKESVLEHLLGSKGVFVSEEATYALAKREDFLTDFVHLRSPKDVFDLQVALLAILGRRSLLWLTPPVRRRHDGANVGVPRVRTG